MEGTDPGQVLPEEGNLVKTFQNNEKWTSAWRREVVKTSERWSEDDGEQGVLARGMDMKLEKDHMVLCRPCFRLWKHFEAFTPVTYSWIPLQHHGEWA